MKRETYHPLSWALGCMLLCCALPGHAWGADPRQAVLKALELELDRSLKGLRTDDFEPPYFMAFQIKDVESFEVTGGSGAVDGESHYRTRYPYAEVRVGSYRLDNFSASDPDDVDTDALEEEGNLPRVAPLDNDPEALQACFWALADQAYKSATREYMKLKGRRVFKVVERDDPDSFTREKASQHTDSPQPFRGRNPHWAEIVRRVSGRFRLDPHIVANEMTLKGEHEVRYLVTSEGTRLITEQTRYQVYILARTRTKEGMPLEDEYTYYALREGELPDEGALVKEAERLMANLAALREAPVLDPYTGPAILEPEAAGVLFHEAIGHRLEGERQKSEKEGRTFKGQLGKAILPSFISVVDDPTKGSMAGHPLNGHYSFDDQGIPAQRVHLVEGGVLRSFLMSRTPLKSFKASNGHGRSSRSLRPQGRMSNLIIESTRTASLPELKAKLIEEAKRQGKPYGLIIKSMTGGSTNTSTYGYQAFKGIPRMTYRVDVRTGKEELVRGVEVVGTPLSSVNKIVMTSREVGVFSGYCGAESGYVPVSAVAPAVFLSEVELQRSSSLLRRGPILAPPWGKRN